MGADPLAPFGQAALAVRWGTTAVSVALAAPDIQDGDTGLLLAAVALVAYAAYRSVRPLRLDGRLLGLAAVAAEAVVCVVVLTRTGHWDSPVAFALLTPAANAGFAGGFGRSGVLALAAALTVTLSWAIDQDLDDDHLRSSAQWSGELLLVALVAGYARRISGEADERREVALDRLGHLTDANVLLFQLHQVTQTLPASLDLTEALDATTEQLRDLFDATALALVLHEEADDGWHVVRSHGVGAGSRLPSELPPPIQRTLALRSPTQEHDLAASGGPGLSDGARSGLYAVLMARGATIGVVVLEHRDTDHFTPRDLELLTGFVDPAALAIDNARWFARLRTVGADEERTRIAKDLHDRTGQSLAYLAFELDRMAKRAGEGKDVTEALDALRGDVRKIVGEVRDTLYDLRTDVTEADGLARTLESFIARVQERSGLEVTYDADETGRLPLLRERELWRIAREALTHVERNAEAQHVTVRWRTDGTSALLEVHDDGSGEGGGSLGTHGLASMRERAASIGATLAVEAEPGRGTRVRCTIAARPEGT